MELVGYSDPLSVRPGASIAFMVSSAHAHFDAEIVRLRHGDERPGGPGPSVRRVPSSVDGRYPGRRQHLRPGSYVRVAHAPELALTDGLGVGLWVWPTLLHAGAQTLVAKRAPDGNGFELQIDASGAVVLRLEGAQGSGTAVSSARVTERVWQRIEAGYDAATGQVHLRVEGATTSAVVAAGAIGCDAPLTFAAVLARMPEGDLAPTRCFNGKLEDVTLTRDGTTVARWDFSLETSSRRVLDVGAARLHGETVNRPARAVTGRLWQRTEVDPRRAPEQWAAIHFHDDDLDDAGWEPDLRWRVPADLPSGIYALVVSAGNSRDEMPFFVCPPRARPRHERPRSGGPRVAFVAPTFSYLAYANEHMMAEPEARQLQGARGVRLSYPVRPAEHYVLDNRLHSLYDLHADGSGVSFASRLRPLVTMRPSTRQPHLSGGAGAAHQLSADLHLVDWLEHEGIAFDVLTDEELHHEGSEVLEPYDVVLSGTHPEYVSAAVIDALEGYVDRGGRFMYLGGNGYYWVTGLDPHDGHTIEVRRWGAATRMWEAAPGEWFLSTTGELGGLWRFRDRAPQRLCGVGFAGEGNGPGRPYERTEAGRRPEVAFVFDGLDLDAPIGDEPALVNGHGAAGFEVDRFDRALGSSPDTLVLASATAFSDRYQAAIDDVLVADSLQGGDVNPLVRADMTLCERPGGGAVFSVGSIQWCSCLSAGGYTGTVARVTANVLHRFLDRSPLGLPKGDG